MVRIVIVSFCLFLSFSLTLNAQSDDTIGPGRAIQFDGVDDYIDLGDRFDNVTLPITISVWVKVSPGIAYALPVFNSQDNLPLYNGFTFTVSAQFFAIQYGDGQGENSPVFRRGKSANNPNIDARWVHLTAIMRGPSDMDLFLNGINIGGQYSGTSNLPMASAFPADVAKIGYWYSNGITTHFKGLMDELRIFNRSLSQTEIREQMCRKLSGNELGLIGYWDFNETSGNVLKDKSANHFDGQIKGNPARVFSSAPIGDESLYLYTTAWTNKSLKLDLIEATNIKGNPAGIHIYKVLDSPSQTTGLDPANVNKPYYGVFLAGIDVGNSFDLKVQDGICKFFRRNNNSEALWSEATILTGLMDHKEIIAYLGDEMEEIDLGPDQIICNQNQYFLKGNIDVTGKTVLWNTGQTTSSIIVTQSGVYSLQVSSGCATDRDSVSIQFLNAPRSFSLGEDESMCVLAPKLLKPFSDTAGFEFEWQDGSKADNFKIQDFGKFWLTVRNACGTSADTIEISLLNEPDPPSVDLGPDQIICDGQQYVLKSNLDVGTNGVRWNTGETTNTITITQSGVYKIQVASTCKTNSDSVKIAFQNPPSLFSLGEDENLCVLHPKVLKPYDNPDGFEFQWQDGSKGYSFEIKDFGKYWLEISNACGVASDTVEISKFNLSLEPPNIITPNGDPLNQYFVIDTVPSSTNRLLIYNRWGENVFSSMDYQNNWDGAGLTNGVYFYLLYGECVGEKKGTVTISH